MKIWLDDLRQVPQGYEGAKSVNEVISFYTSLLVSRLKCTEKLAKMQFAKEYDYIIQLEPNNEDFIIKSIVEITANKAGTPVLRECLSYNAGVYKYKFTEGNVNSDNSLEEKPNNDTPHENIKEDNSNTKQEQYNKAKFSSRFKKSKE